MAFNPLKLAEEHPAITVGVIIVAGLGVALLLSGGGSSAAATTDSTDPNAAAELQYALQQDSESAAASAAAGTQSYNLTSQSNQIAGDLALAQENNATAIVEQNTAAGVTNNANNDQYNATISSISAQLAGLENTNATTVSVANISANENTAIAQTNAGVANNQTSANEAVAINNANQFAAVAENQSNNAASSAFNAGLFGFLGNIL